MDKGFGEFLRTLKGHGTMLTNAQVVELLKVTSELYVNRFNLPTASYDGVRVSIETLKKDNYFHYIGVMSEKRDNCELMFGTGGL